MIDVRLYRDAAEPRGRDLFACSLAQWRFLLELGRTFGWLPEGTTYELRPGSKIVSAARRDYEPGAPSDRKLVDAEDARKLAHALEDAMASAHLPAMIQTHATALPPSENSVASVLHLAAEFVQYAYGGAFVFCRDDARTSQAVR
jgi:hypothetical protein